MTLKLSRIQLNAGEVFKVAKRRIKRLYPLYIVCLSCAILLSIVANHICPVKDLVLHMTFLQNFYWMYTGYSSDLVPFTAHTWTLGIEVWLFLVWLCAFWLLKEGKKRKIFCIVMAVVAVLYRILTVQYIGDPMVTSLFPVAHADAFAVGSLMAMYHIKDGERYGYKLNLKYFACIILGVILIGCCVAITASKKMGMGFAEGYSLYKTSDNYLNNIFTCNIYFFISILSVGLLFFFGKISTVPRNVATDILVKIGDISYAGYLFHWPVRVVVVHVVDNVWLRMLSVSFLTVIACIVIQYFVNFFGSKIDRAKAGGE